MVSIVTRLKCTVTILSANQLGMTDNGRLLHHLFYAMKTSNFGAAENLFKQPKVPVRGKFGVRHYQKGQGNPFVKASQDPSCQVLNDIVVLVLIATVISVQVKSCFTQVVHIQDVMQHADHTVCSFATVDSLINKIIHLSKRIVLH